MTELPYRLELTSSNDAITEAADWAETCAQEFGLAPDRVFAVRLCIEEAVSNVVHHGYGRNPGTIRLEFGERISGAYIAIADNAWAFDPVAAEDPGDEDNILDAAIGGRGIRLMRTFSSAMAYVRDGNENRLTLEF